MRECIDSKYPHRILKGQIYQRQFGIYDGPIEYKTKKVFYDIICKYDLFNDE